MFKHPHERVEGILFGGGYPFIYLCHSSSVNQKNCRTALNIPAGPHS